MDKKIYYLTKTKLAELQKEFDELVKAEKEKTIGEEAPRIVESEDMSNEFVSFQEDMGALRGRIDELKTILENYELIGSPAKEQQEVVGMGATIKVDANGDSAHFTIVGTLEADPDTGRISNESPVGKALLGKRVGEEVLVSSPVGKTYKIKAIKYEIS